MKRLISGPNLHWPIITWSPSFTRKHGDTWAGMFECLFSYLKMFEKFTANFRKRKKNMKRNDQLLKINYNLFASGEEMIVF